MKQIIFPFYNKYPKLSNYWWHRLLIVVFFILVIFSFFFIWFGLNTGEGNVGTRCVDKYYDTCMVNPSNISACINSFCGRGDVHSARNLLFGFIGLVIANYLLQIIYYKIFLYIIFGKRLHELK